MKTYQKYLLEIGASLLGGLILGIIGLIMGMSIGGTFGFPEFHGLVGYESAGIIFSLVGISLGGLLGLMAIAKVLKEKGSYLWASLLSLFCLLMNLFLYNYNVGIWLILMWIIPAIFAIIGFNYRKMFEKR